MVPFLPLLILFCLQCLRHEISLAFFALVSFHPGSSLNAVFRVVPFLQSLLSFKAGKMEVKAKGGDKFHLSADLRKGTVTLFKGPDDQLMHFAWKERPSGTVVDVSSQELIQSCL